MRGRSTSSARMTAGHLLFLGAQQTLQERLHQLLQQRCPRRMKLGHIRIVHKWHWALRLVPKPLHAPAEEDVMVT